MQAAAGEGGADVQSDNTSSPSSLGAARLRLQSMYTELLAEFEVRAAVCINDMDTVSDA
jgi:hypothetical protein